MKKYLSEWWIVVAILSSMPAAASCPELPAIPETDGILWGYTWAFHESQPNAVLASTSEVYGYADKVEVPYYVYRNCARELSKPYISLTKRIDVVADSLFVRVTGEASSFRYFESTEFLGHTEAGTTKLKGPELGFIPAKLLGERHVELQFREPVELGRLGSRGAHEPIRATLAVVATSHALGIAPLAAWDHDWKKDPVDSLIDLQVVWLKISENAKVSHGGGAPSLAGLSSFGEHDPKTIRKLDKKPVLQNLADFFKGYDMEALDYVVLLKDSWDVTAKGLPELTDQLARLPSGAIFDVYSTRTVTESVGYLKALAAERGGRYFESERNDRLDIKDQDVGARVFGKIRVRVRDEAARRGITIDTSPSTVDRLTVLADDPYFEVGNLVTYDHLGQMSYVFRLASCLANRESVSRYEIETYLARAGLLFEAEDQMRPLFRHWFRGFDLPPTSPIARDTPEEMIRHAADDPGVKSYLEEVARALDSLAGSGSSCSTFVPSKIFQPRSEEK